MYNVTLFQCKKLLMYFHESFNNVMETIHAASWLLEELELPSDPSSSHTRSPSRGHVRIRPAHMAAEID